MIGGGVPQHVVPIDQEQAVLDINLTGVLNLARAAVPAIRSLAAELGGSGVTANAVSPGSTDTPILAESARLYGLAHPVDFAGHHPIGRLVEPHEVAAVIGFLLGQRASGMTGAVVPVDGGMAL